MPDNPTDIVERLRTASERRKVSDDGGAMHWLTPGPLMSEAADEIARLRGEVEADERRLAESLGDNERLADLLDRVVNATGGFDKHGDHSNANCPWTNAIEELESQ